MRSLFVALALAVMAPAGVAEAREPNVWGSDDQAPVELPLPPDLVGGATGQGIVLCPPGQPLCNGGSWWRDPEREIAERARRSRPRVEELERQDAEAMLAKYHPLVVDAAAGCALEDPGHEPHWLVSAGRGYGAILLLLTPPVAFVGLVAFLQRQRRARR